MGSLPQISGIEAVEMRSRFGNLDPLTFSKNGNHLKKANLQPTF
ncbi:MULTISPECIES: hypothetical protein [Kamptonema]|nr:MULTISPECIES: hypothetical protein [Kamptonema]CBN56395.1 hypothetical protein OSCI_3000048 [Kamptonema sp. PCC 6506]